MLGSLKLKVSTSSFLTFNFLSKRYLTAKGIIFQSMKSIGNSNMPRLALKVICYGRTDGWTDPIYKKKSLLKMNVKK